MHLLCPKRGKWLQNLEPLYPNVVGGQGFHFHSWQKGSTTTAKGKVSLLDPSTRFLTKEGVLDTMRDLSNKVEIEVSIMVDLDMFNSP